LKKHADLSAYLSLSIHPKDELQSRMTIISGGFRISGGISPGICLEQTLAVGRRKNQKLAESLAAHFRIFFWGGAKEGNRIVIKFCMEVGVYDVISHANLGNDRLGVLKGAGELVHNFLIYFILL